MKKFTRIAAIILAAAMILCSTGCMEVFNESMITDLVQGNLDTVYLGQFSDRYMTITDSTQEECEAAYLEGLEIEAEYFAGYFNIEYLTDDLKAEIVELYKQIYSHSNYIVNPATKLDENTYAVKVQIYPINTIDLVIQEAGNGALDEFLAAYSDDDVASMTEEEYAAYDAAWARLFIDLCYEQLENIDHLEEKTVIVEVAKSSNGLWSITDDSMAAVDEPMIHYP